MTDKIKKTCGLVMPISPVDGCSAEHWSEVKSIIVDALNECSDINFEVKLVSDSDDVGVIQKRIVQNLYSSDVVVCDVSGKNPNVMFELGMRLAFDKPTIIVKDDKTDYSFDTGVIEHVSYRRDLRFTSITSFKQLLRDKVVATLAEAERNPDHSTFLKNFGTFHVASLKESEVSSDKLLIDMVQELQHDVSALRRNRSLHSPTDRSDSLLLSTRIRKAVKSYLTENELITNPKDLLKDKNFFDHVEEVSNAPQLCSSRTDFENLLTDELLKMSA